MLECVFNATYSLVLYEKTQFTSKPTLCHYISYLFYCYLWVYVTLKHSASKITNIVSGGALNSTHSLTKKYNATFFLHWYIYGGGTKVHSKLCFYSLTYLLRQDNQGDHSPDKKNPNFSTKIAGNKSN